MIGGFAWRERGLLDDWLQGYLKRERLPESFRLTAERVCRPLADRCVAWWGQAGRPIVVGLCGAQGSGKTTAAAATVELLRRAGLQALSVSLDDFYFSRGGRARTAERIHPLLRVRGPPGT